MAGSVAANLHEGSRSEYLANYAFASFGTAIAVPHQEDSGIDLYCTLADRLGKRLLPRAHYTVQVKSTTDPWILDGEESVRWLVEHPLPLFLCVVDKSSLRLRVYHTAPRFYVWSLPPLPRRIELIPGEQNEGRAVNWSDGNRFELSAPIVDLTLAELHQPESHAKAREVLDHWLKCDQANLARIRAGIHEFRVPDWYTTNSVRHRGWATQSLSRCDDIDRSTRHLAMVATWVTEQLRVRGDLPGAARGALLLRHLFPDTTTTYDPDELATVVHGVQAALNERLGKNEYLFAGVDALSAVLDAAMQRSDAG